MPIGFGTRVQFTAIGKTPKGLPAAAVQTQLRLYAGAFMVKLLEKVVFYPPPIDYSSGRHRTFSEPHRLRRGPLPKGTRGGNVGSKGHVYIRTGNLLRSWEINAASTADAIRYTIDNKVIDQWGRKYAGWVHGSSGTGVGFGGRGQTWFHEEHGWKNIGIEFARLGGRDQFRAGAQEIINLAVATGTY